MRPFAYRRTFGAAAIAMAVVFAIASTSGEAAESAFVNGYVKATGVVAKVAPGVGSLELAISQGVAVSEVKNDLAQAQAQALDFGIIGTSLTAESCEEESRIKPEQLPAPIRTDNRRGDSARTEDEIPIAGSTLGYGRESVRATKQPMAEAMVTTTPIEAPPLLSIAGGRSHAISRVVDGKAREALASVEASVDIAGIVQLRGLRWDAFHRTGAEPDAKAAFLISEVTAAGLAVPAQDTAAVEEAVNTALAPSGVSIYMPKVERLSAPNDLVRVTPLRIIMKDSPAGATVLGPVMELTREQRGQLFDELVSVYCRSGSVLLVGDITLSVLAGSGFFAVDIGGAEATTSDFAPGNPFGEDPPLALPPPLPEVPPLLPVALPSGLLPGGPETSEQAATAPTDTQVTRPIAGIGPIERVCKSVHPFTGEGCSKGAALPLGILGLAATAGVAALDWRHQRRVRRT